MNRELPSALPQRYVADAEIRRLALDYADAFLIKDADVMLSLWAPGSPPADPPDFDARWARALVQRWDTLTTSVLHVTNHLIWFDDDSNACGRVYCLAQLDQGDAFVDQTIIYDDTYVKLDRGWKFVVRRHLLWFGAVRRYHPLHQPLANWPASQSGRGSLAEELAVIRADSKRTGR